MYEITDISIPLDVIEQKIKDAEIEFDQAHKNLIWLENLLACRKLYDQEITELNSSEGGQ